MLPPQLQHSTADRQNYQLAGEHTAVKYLALNNLMFPSGVGGDQNRAKKRDNTGT